jgi:hypothetical protein
MTLKKLILQRASAVGKQNRSVERHRLRRTASSPGYSLSAYARAVPAGSSGMQKRQRQDPRMIFRARNEPASCPRARGARFRLAVCSGARTGGGIEHDSTINNVAFSANAPAKRPLRIAPHRMRARCRQRRGKSASDTLDLSNCVRLRLLPRFAVSPLEICR